MISKHVEEVLALFRENYRSIKCVESQHDSYKTFVIEASNLYPEIENEEILGLSNNKSLSVSDFEFAEIKKINGKQVIFLGDYRFYFDDSIFNI